MEKRYAGRGSRRNFPRKTIEVDIVGDDGQPETFRLLELSGADADDFSADVMSERVVENADGSKATRREVQLKALRAKLVARCWVDAEGKRVYADDEIEQLNTEWPSGVLGQLFKEAEKLNGLDVAAKDAAAKNSASAPAGASASDSPSPSAGP